MEKPCMPDYILRVGLLIFKSSLWENALEARCNLGYNNIFQDYAPP